MLSVKDVGKELWYSSLEVEEEKEEWFGAGW